MPLENCRILIVEDEVEIADLLALHLGDLGAKVTAVHDGHQGMAMIKQQSWDIALLDIQLPGHSGLELCRAFRTLENYTHIIMLTSRSTELDRVLGLEQGADDYLTKPFSVLELIARIKSQCRRIDAMANMTPSAPEVLDSCLRTGPLTIDLDGRTTLLNGESVELTSKEFDLLVHFVRNPNRVFSRAELLDKVWGYGHDGYEHTVNSHINRLRTKIEADPGQPTLIITIWGVGYKLYQPV